MMPTPFNTLQNLKTRLLGMRSENWGGVAAVIGDTILCLSGDIPGIAAMICAFAGDLVFARLGAKCWGYSLGCLFTAFGDALFANASSTGDNPVLQKLLMITAATYALGVLRYPLEHFAKTKKIANALQPIIGSLSFVLLLPAIVSAAIGGNIIAFFVTGLWAITDILVGRVQDYFIRPTSKLYKRLYSSSPKKS